MRFCKQVCWPTVQSSASSMFDVLTPKSVANKPWQSAAFVAKSPMLCLGALAQGPWCSFSLLSLPRSLEALSLQSLLGGASFNEPAKTTHLPPLLPPIAPSQPVQTPHANLPVEDSREDDAETRQYEEESASDEEGASDGEEDAEDTKNVSSDVTCNTDNSKHVRVADDKEDSGGSPEPSSTASSEASQ